MTSYSVLTSANGLKYTKIKNYYTSTLLHQNCSAFLYIVIRIGIFLYFFRILATLQSQTACRSYKCIIDTHQHFLQTKVVRIKHILDG